MTDKHERLAEIEELIELKSKSTRVVAWYAHSESVRGPWCRWFLIQNGDENHVAPKYDDARFAAMALNMAEPLAKELKLAWKQNEIYKKSLIEISGIDLIGPTWAFRFEANEALKQAEEVKI